jgi:hypothetical protein
LYHRKSGRKPLIHQKKIANHLRNIPNMKKFAEDGITIIQLAFLQQNHSLIDLLSSYGLDRIE